jgi:hypothetical protein
MQKFKKLQLLQTEIANIINRIYPLRLDIHHHQAE